ncbi:MAG: hypothetical protein IPJ40_09170 [Saprospirales bacterium]|nr:hypothetical protein [Saprospirales bacterium]
MIRHKLLQLLGTYSRREITRFRDFVFSPYHNKHKDVQSLVAYLSESYPDFSENTCGRRILFQILFPGERHDQGKLAVIFTYAYRLWEEFACWERMQQRPEESAVQTLGYLRERSGVIFEKTLPRIQQQLEARPFRDGRHHLLQYQLATEADLYFTQQGRHEKDYSIQVKQAHLDRYLISEKLRDACEMAIRKRILRVNYEITLLEGLLKDVEARWDYYQHIPSIAVYFQIYRLLSGAQETYFEVVHALEENEHFFTLEERQLLYHYLQNYCIEQINRGRTEFLRHGFELYQIQLKKELLNVNGTLPEGHYKNLVTIGLRLQENEWVHDFIHSSRAQLHPDVAENAFTFNLASYFYATGQLGQVQELLLRVEYTDLRYNLGAKALLLRTYYDLEEEDALVSLADSFQQYLKRNQLLADERVQAFRRLLRFTKRAMTLRAQAGYLPPGKVRQGVEKLAEQVRRTEPIINKEWLMEKIARLRWRN